jgi:transcriptional regulator with XRE-family HTH domain
MNNQLPTPTAATSLPDLLRGLRRARRLTQSEAARAAGVSRVTLSRWESGTQRPRLPELESLLTALGAGGQERRRAHGLLATPGVVAHAHAAVARLADRAGLSPLPSGADLLRALRRRRGWSPDEAAAAAGVSTATLRRWEAGDSWPDGTRLHALCWALGARAEEISALTVGDFAPRAAPVWADPEPAVLDHELDGLRQRVAQGDYTLMDLHCLTLKAQAWRLAVRGDIGRRLLSRAHQVHAMAVTFRGDQQGARRLAEQAMAIWPASFRRETIWYYCGVLVAQGFIDASSRWGGRRGRETLGPLLDAVAAQPGAAWGGLEVWMLSEMAICLTQEGAGEEAIAVGQEACRIAEIKATPAELARRQSALASLLLKSGRPADALSCLDGITGNTPYHATEMALVRTEASLSIGSPASAQNWLDEAYHLIAETDQGYLQARADALSQRL